MFALDRRWIYLVLGLSVLISLVIPFTVPIPISQEARNIYNYVDSLKAGDVIHLAIDYDPSTIAELHPMSLSILRQCFDKKIKVVVTALHPNGPVMTAMLLDTAVARHFARTGERMKRGIDYVFLGYKPYPALIILGMGQNYRIPFPTDYYNVPVDSLPMMAHVRNLTDVRAVLNVSGTSGTDYWITYGNGRYGVPLALGLTGVMASDYYPYMQTHQIFGLLGGLKGAAEYEELVGAPGRAVEGMKVQVVAHMVIILFIIAGNVGYFAIPKSQRRRLT
ncbi:MAG: hypothetical protein HY304_07950 [candidate division Zixibacteria bacterium]|nr:hypothetical protein [candidate division Zixibacteria bacterium]